jgi:hypothetical protein
MISEKFDEHTIADMEAALDRACNNLPHGGDHAARRRIAYKILERAELGDTTLVALTNAARRAAAEMYPRSPELRRPPKRNR